jgi:uncharacterized membrane-anchored protein YitT (DUF2179 family)
VKDSIIRFTGITIGAAIMGFGINFFNIANNLSEGGVTGISILLNLAFQIDPGLTTIAFNIPLLYLSWKYLGGSSFLWTLYGTLSLSAFLSIFSKYRFPLEHDILLAALYAGVFVGLGLGLIFRFGGTTGGVDILAKLLYKYKGIAMGRTIFIGDVFVIAGSLIYLDIKQGMYTLIAVYAGCRIIELVQDGAYSAKGAFIITSKPDNGLSRAIMDKMNRGITILNGRGGYSNHTKDVLYVVIAARQVGKLKSIIQNVDPQAFVCLTDIHRVMGHGFSPEIMEEAEKEKRKGEKKEHIKDHKIAAVI